MSIENNSRHRSKIPSDKGEAAKGAYTSYNSLTGRSEIKSVSQAMHDYITDGFAKLKPSEKK